METLHVLWFVLGFALLAVEMLTGTFFLLFMGLSALAVGALKFVVNTHWILDVLLFGLLSTALALSYMKRKKKIGATGYAPNESFILDTNIPANGEARVQFHGAPWTALNRTNTNLTKGDRVTVVKTDGVKLILEKSKEN